MSGNIFSLLFSFSDLFLYIFNRLVDLAFLVIYKHVEADMKEIQAP